MKKRRKINKYDILKQTLFNKILTGYAPEILACTPEKQVKQHRNPKPQKF